MNLFGDGDAHAAPDTRGRQVHVHGAARVRRAVRDRLHHPEAAEAAVTMRIDADVRIRQR